MATSALLSYVTNFVEDLFARNPMSSAQVRNRYTSASSTSGCWPSVAEKRSSQVRCIWKVDEGVMPTPMREQASAPGAFDQPDTSPLFEAVSGRSQIET